MYAIRSYYVLSGIIGVLPERLFEPFASESLIVEVRNRGRTTDHQAPLHRTPDGTAQHVITSYSIHYTKLYDDALGTREWQPRTYDDGLIPNFSFEVIGLRVNGDLGVAVLDTETGRESEWNGDAFFPLNT